MKKSKQSSDVLDLLDKQYKAMLLMAKLTAGFSAEIKNLVSAVEEQNALLKQIVSNLPLEEETV